MSEKVAELERQLAACRKTVDVLMERIERDEALGREMRGDASRAIASLEGILRRRSQALRESEARYRALFDRSPDMVLTVDGAGRVTEANARSGEILGDVIDEEVMLDDLFDDPHAAEVLHSVLSGPAGGVLGELTLVDGRRVSITASQIAALDGLSQVVLRDISARRALEEELQHNRRLAAVGHLAAGVAHEINNPLAVIRLRLDLLEGVALEPEVAAPLEVIDRQVDRIARIVRSLQSFARSPTLQREELDLVDVVSGALEASGASLGDTEVLVAVPPGLLVDGDRVQLEQVVTNLLVNASRAMGGVGRVRVHGAKSAGEVVLEVRDEGPGVPEALRADLFTPFVSGRSDGTGLGLAICWSIVEEHGGAIGFENDPAGGAVFTVRLPAHVSAIYTTGDLPPPPAPDEGLTVLVVDDEPQILSLLSAFLAAAGHRTLLSASAEEALALMEAREDIDLLVTDIHLPGKSGLDLLHQLEERDHPLARRAVVMSGLFHRPEGDRVYLQKPFRRTQFLTALEDAWDGGRED